MLRLAERQAGREEELAAAQKRAEEAEVRAEDLAQDVTLLQQQVAALKEVSAALLLVPFLVQCCLCCYLPCHLCSMKLSTKSLYTQALPHFSQRYKNGPVASRAVW